MKKIIVVAKSANNVIGVDNTLPWHLPEDLKHFKQVTLGHPLIMGRLTYESIGRPLPGRKTIVVTRDPNWSAGHEAVHTASSIDAAYACAERLAEEMGVDAVMIVGGAGIYQQTLSDCDELSVTQIDTEIEGDAFFPELDSGQWVIVERSDHISSADEKLRFSCLRYSRWHS